MKIVTITKENRNKYLPYLDADAVEHIGRDCYHAMALQMKNDQPEAVLVWRTEVQADGTDESKTAHLVSYYARNNDFGLPLLVTCGQNCERDEVTSISFEFDGKTQGIDEALFDMLGYTLQHSAESSDLTLTVADFLALPLSQKAQLPENVTSIGALTLNQMRRGIDNCIYRRRTGILPDLAILPVNWFEPELSSCVLIDGRVCGLLLVHKQVSDTLEAELFYASEPAGKQDMIGMIKYTIRYLVANYPADTKVVIHRCNDAARVLTDKLFPGKKGVPVISGEKVIGEKNEQSM